KMRNNNIHKTIQYLSESISEDEQYLMAEAKKVFNSERVIKCKQDEITLSIHKFNTYPTPLQRRVYKLILDYLYEEIPKDLSYTHEELFLSLLTKKKSNICLDFPKALKIE